MIKNTRGFSIVELLVTLVVASIVIGGIYLTSVSQERSMHIEDRVSEVQGNLRAGIYILTKDLRSAGYDPDCTSPPCTGFTSASNTALTFVRNNPATNAQETISYVLYDSGGDGDMDLGRSLNGSTPQPVVENTDTVNFVYFDKNGNRLLPPLSTTDLANIKVVEIALIAHAAVGDPNYSAAGRTFQNFQGETIFIAPTDNFRRRMIRARVFCRNNT